MLEIFPKITHVPFLRWRRYAYVVSLALLLPGLASLLIKGGPRYGVDFTGGVLVQLHFEREVPLDRLRARLGTLGLESFELQRFGDPREVVIRAKGEAGEESRLGDRIEQAVRQDPDLAGNPFQVVRIEAVGPKIGSELQGKAIRAIVFSWIFIIAYLWWRFRGVKFGVTPVIALIHDSLLVIGLFSLLNKEITLDVIAAILTVIGYSVNDSIVVMDRIREKLHTRVRAPMAQLVNDAINETLSRTVITGGLTLVVLVALFFVGGPVIHDFAFALLVGIVVGTYSSIFVVAPLLVEWEAFAQKRRARKLAEKGAAERGEPAGAPSARGIAPRPAQAVPPTPPVRPAPPPAPAQAAAPSENGEGATPAEAGRAGKGASRSRQKAKRRHRR